MNIVMPYSPRWWQQELHDAWDAKRFGTAVFHRRAGKTMAQAAHLIREAWRTDRDSWRGAYVSATYAQAKAIVWDTMRFLLKDVPSEYVKYNESELRIDFANGSRIRVYGGDNPDALRGIALDMACIDEADIVKPEVFTAVLRPALSDRQGRCLFAGTYKSENGFLGQMWDHAGENPDEWFRLDYNVEDTGATTRTKDEAEYGELCAEELEEAKRVMSPEEYAREYMNVRAGAVRGSILGKFIDEADVEGRITRVQYDPQLPVSTAWDLGVGDSTAIWFAQVVHREVRIIDYYEASGESLEHYTKYLTEKPWSWRHHFAPHDIQVRELGTGKSRLEVAAQLGINFIVLPAVAKTLKSYVSERIELARGMLPNCWFDATACKRGIEALRSWKWAENASTGELKNTPQHDWASHGGDGFTYLAQGLHRGSGRVQRPKVNVSWVT